MCRSHTAVGWEGALGALRQLGGSKSHGDLEAGAAPLGLPDCLPLPRGSGVCVARTLGANRIALPASPRRAGPRGTPLAQRRFVLTLMRGRGRLTLLYAH